MRWLCRFLLCCGLTVAGCSSSNASECGDPNPKLTADGREVIYKRVFCEPSGLWRSRAVESYLVVYDVETQATSRISLRATSFHVPFDVSSNGQVIVYEQNTLSPPGQSEVYIYDRDDRRTTTVDISEVGRLLTTTPPQAPRVSGDGQVVAFVVQRDQDYGVVIYERPTTRLEEATTEPKAASPSLSNDGRFLAYQTGGCSDCETSAIWVLDRDTGQRALVSVNSGGEPANAESFEPAISGDARFVVFRSAATNLGPPPPSGWGTAAEVYLHDRDTGTTSLLSRDADSGGASGTIALDVAALMTVTSHAITSDGQVVVYQSNAANIVPPKSQIDGPASSTYRYDALAADTSRVSINSLGEPADGDVQLSPSVSDDGRLIAFQADATNLDPGDQEPNLDVYLHDVESEETRWVSR